MQTLRAPSACSGIAARRTTGARRAAAAPAATAAPRPYIHGGSPCASQGRATARRGARIVCAAEGDGSGRPEDTPFGYTRFDVLLIGGGLIALGYGLYYGLQATGMEPGMAGNWVQLIIFLGICVGWISTYLYRVATKQMTYAKQLEQYEEAVMQKRLEEMPDSALEQMMGDIEEDKKKREARRAAREAEQQKQ